MQATAACLLTAVIGCASPGPLRAPALHLPAVVKDLTARREGDVVHLHFTAPAKDTDKMLLKGNMTAELCRQSGAATCVTIARQPVAARREPQEVALEDRLPPALTVDPVVLVTYRVRLLNDKGKSAGFSDATYSAGGAASPRMIGLKAEGSERGAVLRWVPEVGRTDAVEVERIHVEDGRPANGTGDASSSSAPGSASNKAVDNPFKPAAEPHEETLSVNTAAGDPGGTVDATAQFGQSYTYSAERVRRLAIAGHAVEIRGMASEVAMLALRDTFPPQTPRGLTAAPGSEGGGIDLSWEVNTEPDLAGYFVYRAEAGSAPVRLTEAPLTAPAFHDGTARTGTQYRYAVSAVDLSGNESGRSVETAESIQ